MRLALLLVLLGGCHFYVEDDEGDGDDLGDAVRDDASAWLPDAGNWPPDAGLTDCDPASVLPTGFAPVAAVSAGEVSNEPGGDDEPGVWVTTIDASAGGAANQAMNPFVYLRLTAEGAIKVEVDDPASFASDEWDIAIKRYVIRANAGDSGSGISRVSSVPSEDLTYANVPSGNFGDDDWTSDDCTLIADDVGGPRTRFSNWYDVQGGRFNPTGVIHFVRLQDEFHAEVDVETYYGDGGNPDRGGIDILRWRRF